MGHSMELLPRGSVQKCTSDNSELSLQPNMWRRLFCILIGPKIRKKSGFFEKKKSLKTPLKQGFGLKRTSESSPAYFFTPPGPSLEAKAPRNTSFRQNLSFYSSFYAFFEHFFLDFFPECSESTNDLENPIIVDANLSIS